MKSLLQTKAWTSLKESQGWKVHHLEGISVLQKQLPFKKSFLYAPEVDWEDISTKLQNLCENTKKIAPKNNTIFFRLEILDEFDTKIVAKLKQNHFIKAFEEVQPEYRQIIDIRPSEEEIFKQMKPKGRYNIRVAQKHAVTIEKTPSFAETSEGKQNIDEFYKIFRETAKRDGFEIRPKQYFENLLQILGRKAATSHSDPELVEGEEPPTTVGYKTSLEIPRPTARRPRNDYQNEIAELWQAKYNGKTIAAVIVTFYDGVASYLYGASSAEFRKVMAPYLLHWQAIRIAKEKGCQYYDLLAIEPFKENGNGKCEMGSHKHAGITRFKEQFGGRKVHLVGSYDLVYQPGWYWMFKIAESFRRR